MTDANDSNLVDMDDLDTFSDSFFGKETPKEEVVVEADEVDENENDQLATDEDIDAEPEDDETSEEEDDEDEEEVEEPEEEPKPKPRNRKSAKERIEALVAEARVAQRERDAFQRETEALKQQLATKVEKVEEPALRDQLPPEAPNPDALNDKNEPVYALGEFDPKFIRDLTRFTIEQETKAMKEQQAKEAKAQELANERAQLQTNWAEKVQNIEEELPDFREKVLGLTNSFNNVEPQYGEYLATTIMSCDNGPEIMYYLSQNIGEAQKIVASGPFAATLAIGRLQARLEKPAEKEPVQEEKRNKKVSEAPKPPEMRVRGKAGQFSVRSDTDDLDAFEREFFKKTGRR